MSDEGDALHAARVAMLKATDWGGVVKRLTVKARRWGLSPAAAEDVAQDAIVHVLRTEGGSWNLEAHPTVYRHLLYVMDWKRDARLTLEALRQEALPTEVDSAKVDESPPESDRGVERELLEREAIVRNLGRLRAGLRESPVALALLELCSREGLVKPAHAAERLGVDVKQVYTAEAQLRRHVRRLRGDGSDPAARPVTEARDAG